MISINVSSLISEGLSEHRERSLSVQGARRHHRGYREIYVHYNSKVLSERGGAGQRVGYTKTSPRASPNRITQNHKRVAGLEEI